MTNSNTTAKKLYKVFVQKYNPDTEDEIKSSATKLNISIDEAAHRVDVFMDVNRRTLKGAYKVFTKAIEQAVADGALDKKVAEFAYFADDINDIDFAGKDYFIANDNLNNSFAYGIDDNGDNGYYFWFWALTEAAEEIAEVNTDAKEETTMTITTKIAKNGATIYYVDGKRISRDKAEQLERDARREARINKARARFENILDEYESKAGVEHIKGEGYKVIIGDYSTYPDFAVAKRNYSNVDEAIGAVRYFANTKSNFQRYGKVTTSEFDEKEYITVDTEYFTYYTWTKPQQKYTDAYYGENGYDESAFALLPALDELNDVDIDDDGDDDNNNDTQSAAEDFVEEYIFIDAAPVNHIVKVKCTCTIINGEELLTQAGTPRIVRSDKYGAEIQFIANGDIAYYTFDDKDFDRQAEADFFAIMADRGACILDAEPKPCLLDWDDSAIGNTEDESDKIFADPAAYAAAVEAAFKAQYPEGKAILKPAC